MADQLLLIDRIRNTIALGESHFREFKSAFEGPDGKKRPRRPASICQDIAEALVAFANADGGELIVGVEDHGAITGVPHGDDDIRLMMEAPDTHTHEKTKLPLAVSSAIEIDGQKVIFFSVNKGTHEICQLSDGRCMCRKDKATMPESPHTIIFERQERKSREVDREFVDNFGVADLDVTYIQSLADNYLKGLSVERYLQQLGIAEYTATGLKLRAAAVLLFGREVHRFHPRCQVRILKIAGTELKTGDEYNVTSDEQVQGNILDLLVTSWEKLRPYLAYKTEFGHDARFVQKYLYPEAACREALVNAIAHRDYSISNGIDVFIFDDRMEIRSPGALLSTLKIKDLEALEGAHESRNSFIARVLRENKFMRELGEGIKRMFKLMEESELELPKLFTDATSFTVVLKNKSVFTEREEKWIELFDEFDLTTLQKRIVVLGSDDKELSPDDIYKAINTQDRDTYDREVSALRKIGILQEVRTNAEASRISKTKGVKKGKIARFRVSLPGEKTGKDITTGVFVANFPLETQKKELWDIFSRIGVVTSIDLPQFDGKSRGFGFVWFDSQEAARRAIRELDRHELQGRIIKVDKIRPGGGGNSRNDG